MANYNRAIPVILEFEGGLCDDAYDTGGLTKFGVCLEFAKDTGDLILFDKTGDNKITREDIKKLTIDDAKKAFKKYFWDQYDLDENPSDRKALLIFDSAVNHGNGGATALLQKALNSMGCSLVVDGCFGPKTNRAFIDASEDRLIDSFLEFRKKLYNRIVERNSTQAKFLKGWMNRVSGLRKVLDEWKQSAD